MKIVLVPILSSVIVLSVAFLLVGLRSASDDRNLNLVGSSLSSPLFVFSVFNVIVIAVLLVSHNPGEYEAGVGIISLDGEEAYGGDADKCGGQHDGDGYGCGGADEDTSDSDQSVDSDGYDEDDDDDSGSEHDTGWEDEEEQDGDGDLEKRIEDFIDNVIKGWREERMKEISTQI